MGDLMPMCELIEHQRRKKAARGRHVLLADGQPWLLGEPAFRPDVVSLTTPDVDAEIDRFHEQIVLGEDLSLVDIHLVARRLLLLNYDLTDDDVAELLEVDEGSEAETLARAVLESVFGTDQRVRSYVDWVRASLLANGLTHSEIPASAINDVLTILIATNRTIPPSQFVDSCRVANDRDLLERLV